MRLLSQNRKNLTEGHLITQFLVYVMYEYSSVIRLDLVVLSIHMCLHGLTRFDSAEQGFAPLSQQGYLLEGVSLTHDA